MKVVKPSFSAFFARVPITSSASNPGTPRAGILNASKILWIKGTASLIASGVASRFALYSGKISCRSVGSGRSKQTAICVGFSLLTNQVKH